MSESVIGAAARLGPRVSARIVRAELRKSAMRLHPLYANPGVCDDDGIFIVGCGRSGTTLLREMLDRHSNIASGPETQFLRRMPNIKWISATWGMPVDEVKRRLAAHTSIAPFAGEFLRDYAHSRKKKRWLDKTPGNVTELHWLFTAFPNARFIHVIRDGRDVVCSRRAFQRHDVRKGKVVVKARQRETSVANESAWWVKAVSAGLAFRNHPRVHEVRYEQLLENTEREVRAVCEYLHEPFEPAMLVTNAHKTQAEPGRLHHTPNANQPIDISRTGAWKTKMSREDCLEFHHVAGALLAHLEYEPDDAWITSAT